MKWLNDKLDELLRLIFIDYFPITFVVIVIGVISLSVYLTKYAE